MEFREKVALNDWTWWKIGGPADFFCTPESVEEVSEAVAFANARALPLTVLGGGTNVLISDEGIAGLVVSLRKLKGLGAVEAQGHLVITALAGTPKAELTKIFLQKSLAPALFLCGIPGEIGGGVTMNAGVAEAIQPREFHGIVDWIEVLGLNGQMQRFSKEQLTWSYRTLTGYPPGIIVRVGLSWPLASDDEIPRKVKDATRVRLQRQPLEWPSCGSTFKNPLPQKAGQLIEAAGLKGYQRGNAQVSIKHSNFIINRGGALAQDVAEIIRHVQSEVRQKFGVELEPEVKRLGRW